MSTPESLNRHPAAMFEIMAANQEALIKFYQAVFGWRVEMKEGFGYVPFPVQSRALLGGIGQAQPGVVGWSKGITFYLEVERIDKPLTDQIAAHGGKVVVQPTVAGGYTFAMFEDPEHNLIGLIEKF